MNCDDSLRLVEITVGGTAPYAEVDVDPATASAHAAHLAACSACADEATLLRGTAAELEQCLAPSPGDARATEALVAALRPRLAETPGPAPAGRLLWLPWAAAAAAVLLVGAAASSFLWRSPLDDPLPGVASTYPITIPAPDDYAGPRFEDVTETAGVGAMDHTGDPTAKDWMVEAVGKGAAVLDIDGDGDLDLFVPDGNLLDVTRRKSNTWRLFRNDGGLRFTDVSAAAGVDLDDWGACAVAGDLNADGATDLFVGCYGHNRLFLGRGDGTFVDTSESSGITGRQDEWSVAAALGDVDGDGDLDLYVANYADLANYRSSLPGARQCNWKEMPIACGPMNLTPQRDRLYINRGDGTFDDGTRRLPPVRRYSFQPIIADFTGDGRADIFVAADAHPNQMLVGREDGTFEDMALAAGVASNASGHEQACMGVAPGDMDGDGQLDLFVTNFSHEPNVYYRGEGRVGMAPLFEDVTSPAGVHDATFLTLGWGVSAVDVDCDGDLDLLTANGHLYPDVQEHVPETSYAQHLAYFENDGTGRLREVTGSAGSALAVPRVHRGLVSADFDDDGRPDVFATVLNGTSILLRNDARRAGRGIHLDLRRKDGKVEGAGSRVTFRVRHGSEIRTRVRVLLLGSSFASCEDPRLHLGLAEGEALVGITVAWPGGVTQEIDVDPALARTTGTRLQFVEGDTRVRVLR